MGDKIQAHKKIDFQFRSVQSLSRVWFFAAPGTAAHQASLYHQHPELAHTHIYWVGDAIQPSHPLSSPSPPTFNLSQHQGLFSPSNEYTGLIFFRMDWLYLLSVQGNLKSLFQHHSSKAWIILCLAFFIVQLSHLHMTIGKTISLTRQTFVGKVMSLLFNMLSRSLISFLPRSKCLFFSWL